MIFFNCDYNEGAHERIIKRLVETNLEQTTGYGEDDYCRQAAEMILEKCELPEGQVHFLVGGTQTNLTVIAACLKPWQGVISADTGHINCHETGAIEATGHKVLALPGRNGKLKGDQIREVVKAHREDGSHEHMVQPGMVYISNPTEIGTIYHQKSLEDLYNACQECGLYLYIDGARMGYGLMARDNDLTLPFIARHCDAFTLGGTKQGALFGEAVVITNPALGKDFRYLIKQRGGMLAKGRLLGIQFQELMKDDLYIEDTGIGIAPEDLPRIFEKGYTGYNGRRDKKSTGIGLYLCQEILKRLAHGITITSTLGEGTKVTLDLLRNFSL